MNNTIIPVPANFRGYDQAQRDRFFGVLEIPVPFSLLNTNNQISVQLPDTGGHISSVALQVFNFSKNILSVNDYTFENDKVITVYPNPVDEELSLQSTSENILNATALIYTASGKLVQKQTIPNLNSKINVSNLTKGIYFIQISKENKKLKSIKFSKK
ncbi:T9SS type A sorting domain-containing protein [Flavobacterium sp. NG2]|uniref:T9SS type A sorting domain-containing protein n=1 Tax=Flavobacterium sp. NG2 TaxID=3097547 RepID=UPI002A8340BE|nr:T9SS type A sorting domain-containing protein [Flavobacterium sp. NG2]WPR73129.1 T9SS type A sorting domain-containing protein [Flavobacterium sp. NG2]